MKISAKPIFIISLILLGIGGLFLFLRPKPVRLESKGKLQNGETYNVICNLLPDPDFSLNNRAYKVKSLELVMADRSRAVPSMALKDVVGIDPAQPLQVFEEGPVLVVVTRSENAQPPIQWRFLNGQFAQRRILKKGEQEISNFQSSIDRPSIVAPATRVNLRSSSLLSDESSSTPTPRQP